MSGNAHATGQGKRSDASKHPSMSPGAGFETVWKELRPRTIALLERRGAPRDIAEDVAQETAIRLLKNWHLLDESRPTWPFVRRIALNCLVDRHRREHFDTVGTLPDREGPHNVEEHSLARFRLTEVWRAMAGLSQKERSILLAEVGIANAHGNDSATKMARYRARQKLTAAVGRSAFSGIPVMWRRITGWVQLHGPAYVDVGTAAGLAMIVSAAAVTWSHSSQAATKPQPRILRSMNISEQLAEPSGVREVARAPQRPAGRSASGDTAAQPEIPQPTHSHTPDTSTGAAAGPARAEAGQNGGATYVKVCTGENTQTPHDDAEVTVVIFDGDQDPDDDAPECNHGGQGEGP